MKPRTLLLALIVAASAAAVVVVEPATAQGMKGKMGPGMMQGEMGQQPKGQGMPPQGDMGSDMMGPGMMRIAWQQLRAAIKKTDDPWAKHLRVQAIKPKEPITQVAEHD